MRQISATFFLDSLQKLLLLIWAVMVIEHLSKEAFLLSNVKYNLHSMSSKETANYYETKVNIVIKFHFAGTLSTLKFAA